ncbi:hypothetical protein MSG28_005847 [Choristoneura fumiferana]|nr:hypothetical protein MSG28_005847 [Choristoneura fumiferana]
MKSALHTFKSPTHMDKQVENLEIKLDPESCKLIFQLRCKHGIVKTHFVSILDCKAMQAVYTKDLVPNRITSPHKILSEALSNFQSSDDQVTVEVSSQNMLLRNYIDTLADLSKVIRTQVTLKPAEFDGYTIGADTMITFTLKEFKALLAFAEALSLPIQIHFETTGRPVVFIVHNGSTFEAHFVLATSKADNASQITTQNTTHNERTKRKDVSSSNHSARKKPNLNTDISKCLEEDSHLFNFIHIPEEHPVAVSTDGNVGNNNPQIENNMDCDVILPSPTAKALIRRVFKRCFEQTIDLTNIQGTVLAEDSDPDT